jgi:hypothetical protein
LKRRILFSLLSLVLILSLVIIPTGCPKRDAATPTTDAERIAALESKVSQLQSKIASLPESDSTDYSGDINALYDDIGTLYDEIDNLGMELDDILVEVDEMLATWEEEQEASNGSSSSGGEGETTRWTPTISLEQASLDVAIDASSIKWHPSSIREEDTYSIAFEVTNSHQDEARQVSLVIVFTPSSRDTVVDIGNTGLYSTTSPIIWWDSDFTPSDGVECRRIEFISDLFSIPKDTTLEISLDFDLYYAE